MGFATPYMWLNIIVFLVGLGVLIKGSDWFVESAAAIARHYKVPDVIIGLTLVSIGTSLPEFATNVYAAYNDLPEVALGNVAGSNIANVLLVLGVTVIFMKSVPVDKILFNRDTVVMALAFLVFGVMCYAFPVNNPEVSRIEGGILLLAFVVYMVYLIKHKDEMQAEVEDNAEKKARKKPASPVKAIPLLLLGGVMVVLGAKGMVDNVVWIAKVLLDGKMEPEKAHALISATVIAFGTSAPELAVTLTGIYRKKTDIALGNVIGSNIFNLVFVMGSTALVAPVRVSGEIATLALPFMIGSGVLLLIFMRSSWKLVRWEGYILVLGYLTFIGINVFRCL